MFSKFLEYVTVALIGALAIMVATIALAEAQEKKKAPFIPMPMRIGCLPHPALVAMLHDEYGEVPSGLFGVVQDDPTAAGGLIFVSRKKTYSWVIALRNGYSCIAFSGVDWSGEVPENAPASKVDGPPA